MLVNWCLEPFFKVRARKYRFRILNASTSRWFKLALVCERNDIKGSLAGPIGSSRSYDVVPFWMIANDGNLLMHAVKFDGTLKTIKGVLPTIAPAERYDIIVDFSKFRHDVAPRVVLI